MIVVFLKLKFPKKKKMTSTSKRLPATRPESLEAPPKRARTAGLFVSYSDDAWPADRPLFVSNMVTNVVPNVKKNDVSGESEAVELK